MNEFSREPTLLGLRDDAGSEIVQDPVYIELAQAILEKERRSTLVQEHMQVDQYEREKKVEAIKDRNRWSANLLARMQNESNQNFKYGLSQESVCIFDLEDMQAHYERVSQHGITELTPEQAQIALGYLKKDKEARDVYKELQTTMEERIQEAQISGDTSTYFMWWTARRTLSADSVRGLASYLNEDGSIPSYEQMVEHVEDQSERWEVEAQAYSKLREMIDEIPEDPLRPRVAITRMSRKVDPRGSARILIDFPPDTFKANAGMYRSADTERRAFYSGSDVPACVADAYYRFYQLTRKETDGGQFEARPFYVTSYEAQGIENIEDFPDEARHILELSFHDSDEKIPEARTQMQEEYPGLIYIHKEAIDHTDLEQVYIGDDGLAHFILDRDDNGNPIRQDTIQYSLKAVMSGFSNVTNIPVEKL